MPGRQAHGRPILAGPAKRQKNHEPSKARAKKQALDAYAIAEETHGNRVKRTPRNRDLDAEIGGKHSRDEEDENDEDEEEAPRKRLRRGGDLDDGDDMDYGSDSDGNEWKVGVDEDDDSDIESDDAFGESDEERFQGYAFRGSTKKDQRQEEGDSDDEADGESLGSDAMDLADVLDMSMSDDDAEEAEGDESGSGDEGSSTDASSASEVEDNDEIDASEALKSVVSKFSGVDNDDEDVVDTMSSKPKLSLKDLGLLGVKDPDLKKSLKLMTKEEKTSKPNKLEVPLAKREQDKLDRSAAYVKSNEQMGRWQETVKKNRRAEHLMFPLKQTEEGLAKFDNSEIMPLSEKTAGNELESTILAIMEESGLGPKKEAEKQQIPEGPEGLSRSELKNLWAEKRRDRELRSREDARAKRIKKIKSKAYHRVHKKQRQRDEEKERAVMEAEGLINSEDEKEAQDRRRALERVGARHRESRWAKMANKRAAWDDDARMGVSELARRDQELRRRIEGKTRGSDEEDEDDESGESDDDGDRRRLLQDLDNTGASDEEVGDSSLMKMPFMRKAEAAKKKANDELVQQIRRELASDDELVDSDGEVVDIGRKRYGMPSMKVTPGDQEDAQGSHKPSKRNQGPERKFVQEESKATKAPTDRIMFSELTGPKYVTAEPTGDAWSKKAPGIKKKAASNAKVLDLDLVSAAKSILPAAVPKKSTPKPKDTGVSTQANGEDDTSDSDAELETHHPLAIADRNLADRAFAGDDVYADFEAEKAAVEEDDDDKIVDNTLPGWGSWVGDGVSKRDQKRNQGRFLKKLEGVKKNDRKDKGLEKVIINEKRVRKSEKYLASQLPHPFESRLQYERSLRLPVGREWVTKETFQDATKPKVIVKQGIIAPMSRPMS